jgi:Holliday junction DNA helicase RuvA
MIIGIEGILKEAEPLRIVIDVQGVYYEVHIPLPTASQLPPIGERVYLHTYAVYREDAQTLYGFHEKPLRHAFYLLIEKVSGIGPKTGLAILSRLSLDLLQQAIVEENVNALSKCPGIGKKTAERLIIELKDKMGTLGPVSIKTTAINTPAWHDHEGVLALISLGFKPQEAEKAIQKAIHTLGEKATIPQLIRTALSQS